MSRIIAGLLLSCSCLPLPAQEPASANLLPNGGFEDGERGWGFEDWKGKPLPGCIAGTGAREGSRCFVFTEPGVMTPRFMKTEAFPVDRTAGMVLRFSLAGEGVRQGGVHVRLLQYGAAEDPRKPWKAPVIGWVRREGGGEDLVSGIGGDFPWRDFTVRLPPGAFDARTATGAVFFSVDNPSFGELRIDAVSITAE